MNDLGDEGSGLDSSSCARPNRTRDIAPIDMAARSYGSGAAMSTTPRNARIQSNSEIMTAATLDQYW
jgi:hypothetical protein